MSVVVVDPYKVATPVYLNSYISLPGSGAAYAKTPDSVANSITGDLDIRVRLAATDWTRGAQNSAVGKQTRTTLSSWNTYINGTGFPVFGVSPDGTDAAKVNVTSTAAIAAADGATIWYRVTWRASDGRVQFFTAADATSVPSSWTQLGTDRTANVGSIFNTTVDVQVGANNSADLLIGKIYYVEIRSGIDGTIVNVCDPNEWDAGTTWSSADTGEVWTLNGTAAIVKVL